MSVHICTHSRVPVCSPFFRKSKIAVSLNSFPLAAQTAFVLQTKRKRNETEGSEEAGEGGRERVRAKEQTEKEGNAEAEPDKGKSEAPEEEPTARDRQEAGGFMGSSPPLPPRGPGSPHSKTSKMQRNSLLSPPRALGEGTSRWAKCLASGKSRCPPPWPLAVTCPSPRHRTPKGSTESSFPGSHPHQPPAVGILSPGSGLSPHSRLPPTRAVPEAVPTGKAVLKPPSRVTVPLHSSLWPRPPSHLSQKPPSWALLPLAPQPTPLCSQPAS